MKEWIYVVAKYFLSDWRNLMIGGLAVVSVVIFLMGCVKIQLKKSIRNDKIRALILAWGSVVLTLPITALSIIWRGYDPSNFWGIFTVYALETILVYWLYEFTALREALGWIAGLGKRLLKKLSSAKSREEINKILSDNDKEIEDLLHEQFKTDTKKYNDDLKL